MTLEREINRWASAYVRWQPIQLFMCVVIFVSCGNYVASTYFRSTCTLTEDMNGETDCDDDRKYLVGKQITAIIELFVVICFVFDYVASACYYPSFLEYSSSLYGIVDVVVMLPIFYFFSINSSILALILVICASILMGVVFMDMIRVHALSVKRIIGAAFIALVLLIAARAVRVTNGLLTLQFISVLKIFKASQIIRMNHASQYASALSVDSNSNLNSQIMALTMKLIAIMFIATGLVQEASILNPDSFSSANEDSSLNWVTSFYFVLITFSTVGYGDVTPSSVVTKLGVVLFIVVSMTYIVGEIAKLQQIASERIPNRTGFTLPHGGGISSHIVLCGHLRTSAIARFLEEYYHAERNRWKFTVILCPTQEDSSIFAQMARLLEYRNNVQFIHGDPTNDDDLSLCQCSSATHIYLLTRPCRDPKEEEVYMAMAALAINRHCWRHPDVKKSSDLPRLLAEGRSYSAIRTLLAMGVTSPVNVESFKASLLSFGAIYHGFIALFVNLLTSSRHDPFKHKHRGATKRWEDAYLEGTKFEVFAVHLDHSSSCNERKGSHNKKSSSVAGSIRGKVVIGSTWLELSSTVYLNSGSILLGVIDDDESEIGVPYLNPDVHYQISTRTRCVFIITDNLKRAVEALEYSSINKNLRQDCVTETSCCDTSTAINMNAAAKTSAHLSSDESAIVSRNMRQNGHSLFREHSENHTSCNSSNNIVLLLPSGASINTAALFISSLIEIDETVQIVVVTESTDLMQLIEGARDDAMPLGLPIHHEIGSPKDPRILKRAGIFKAKAVVFLAEESIHEVPEYGYASYQDRQTILTAVEADNIFKEHEVFNSFSLYELESDSSVSFLMQHSGADLFLDIARPPSVFMWPVFAAGRVFTHAILDTLIMPLSANPEQASIWTALFGMNTDGFSLEPVPSEMCGKKYGDLFLSRCNKGETLLGLYRPKGTLESSLPFTSTNPSKDTVLVPNDQMFVIKSNSRHRSASKKSNKFWMWSGANND